MSAQGLGRFKTFRQKRFNLRESCHCGDCVVPTLTFECPVCVFRRWPWSTTANVVCSDTAPNGGVAGATDRAGIPVGHGTDLFGARQ
jgi:hypothetical protein